MALPKIPGSLDSISMGQLGADWLDDVAVIHDGDWAVITALADTVFTTLLTSTVSLNGAAPVNLNGKGLSAGMTIYGRFSRITLASGSVLAMRAVAR